MKLIQLLGVLNLNENFPQLLQPAKTFKFFLKTLSCNSSMSQPNRTISTIINSSHSNNITHNNNSNVQQQQQFWPINNQHNQKRAMDTKGKVLEHSVFPTYDTILGTYYKVFQLSTVLFKNVEKSIYWMCLFLILPKLVTLLEQSLQVAWSVT